MNIYIFLYNCSALIFNLIQILVSLLTFRPRYFEQNKSNNRVHVLYKSNNFLVIDKPYDMFINSNNPERKCTLQSELRKMLPDLANPKLCHEFHFVHRLDYVTSGVICIALNKKAARAASTAFENREVKKFYLALVHGHINDSYVIINIPVDQQHKNSIRLQSPLLIGDDIREKKGNHRMCTSDSTFCEKPRTSFTVLIVLERGFRKGKPATKVLLCPGTGRRHQLRVHCYHIGHTIIGDYTYSEGKDIEPHRTFLHSYRLILNNAIENLDIRTADPFDASNPTNQWNLTNVVRALDDDIFSDIYKLTE